MLQTIKFPATVADLDSGLANVDAETLSHDEVDHVLVDKDTEDAGEVAACNVQYPTLD